jgi:hypothetical protein
LAGRPRFFPSVFSAAGLAAGFAGFLGSPFFFSAMIIFLWVMPGRLTYGPAKTPYIYIPGLMARLHTNH